jgi:D-amino acid aminotransferase
MTHIFLNGRVVPEPEGRLPANDRAILFGDAAYETMRSYGGRFFRFQEHLDRLRQSAREIGLEVPLPDGAITDGAYELIRKNGIEQARLRLTLTGGLHEGPIRLARPHPPNLVMAAFPLVTPPPAAYRDGVSAVVSGWRVHSDSPLPRVKTINRLMHLMAKEQAIEAGAWDALFLDERDRLLEGTATNVFFVLDGALTTPPLRSPILAGVTRDAVLQLARSLGIESRESSIALNEAANADEAFFTGSTIELLPITQLEGRPLGGGRPGPVWRRLLNGYRDLVCDETGAAREPVPAG